jgi:TRAP-type transport system periplasmic protein
MDKPCRQILIVPAVILLGLALVGSAHADGVHLKIATLAPKGSIYHRSLQEIAAGATEVEPGSSATIYTDGGHGGEADIVRRMRIGQLNGALLTTIGLSEIDESVSVMQKMPLLFRSAAEVEYVGRALRPELERRIADKGFVVLFWGEAGWVRFFAKGTIATPEDLRARRIFAWAGDPEQVEVMKKLGYRPVVLETADIVPGLETGLIDAVPLTPFWGLAMQVDGLANHMLDLRWAPVTGALVVSRSTFDALSPAAQKNMRSVAARVEGELRVYQERADGEAVIAMEKRGLKVDHPTPDQEREWHALAEQLYPLLRGHTVPADTFDATLALLARYRAQARDER